MPEMIQQDEGAPAKATPFFRLETLKKRREFQDAASGPRYSTPSFTMVRRLPLPADAVTLEPIRFGFTITKKVGNAVIRNRIRRRLREAVRAAAPHFPSLPLDLVILARREAISIGFEALCADIARAVQVLSRRNNPGRPRASGRGVNR